MIEFKCYNYSSLKGFKPDTKYKARRYKSHYSFGSNYFEVYNEDRKAWVFLGHVIFSQYFKVNLKELGFNPLKTVINYN